MTTLEEKIKALLPTEVDNVSVIEEDGYAHIFIHLLSARINTKLAKPLEELTSEDEDILAKNTVRNFSLVVASLAANSHVSERELVAFRR